MNNLISRIGFRSAVLTFVFGAGYIVAQFFQFAGIPAAPWHLITLTFPSFLLAPSFVVLMISIYHYATAERKIWGHIAIAFAIMYATLNSAVYFVQMTVVVPSMLNGAGSSVAPITLSIGTFIYAFDVLGYSFMGLATLFAAFVFVGGTIERWTRWALIANGLIPTPGLLLQQQIPAALYLGAVWVVTFPVATALLAVLFKRAYTQGTV
ncbi:MAG: hypothetical protein ACXVIF_07705 [Halobacteriota archaeon]